MISYRTWPGAPFGRRLGPAALTAFICLVGRTAAAAAVPVEITVVGTEADLDRVRSLLPPRDIIWSHTSTFDPRDLLRPSPTLRAWIELRPTQARLYFSSPSSSSSSSSSSSPSDRYLLRDVPLSGRFDEVDRAALTEVLELSISALLSDPRAGLTRQETEALLTPPPPPAASPPAPSPPRRPSPLAAAPALIDRPYRFGFATYYAVQALTAGAPLAHGPGLLLLFARTSARPTLAPWISGQYRFTERVRSEPVGVDLDTVSFRAGLELRWGGLSDPFGLRLGAGADLVRLSPRSSSPQAALTPERWTRDLAFTTALRASFRLDGRSAIAALLVVDLLPAATRYEVEADRQRAAVFTPWRLRPGLALEASFR